MTHREADEKRIEYEQKARAWLAWHIVALDRTKRLPPLKSLVGPAKPERKAQTWQEQAAIARQLNAAFGGRVITQEQPNA